MKTNQLRCMSRAVIVAVVAFLSAASVEGADVKDMNTVFQQGRAAFYKGDLETAKALLTQVAAVSPNHFETKALLAQINTYSKADTSLKKTYSGVTIPKETDGSYVIDFMKLSLNVVEGTTGIPSRTLLPSRLQARAVRGGIVFGGVVGGEVEAIVTDVGGSVLFRGTVSGGRGSERLIPIAQDRLQGVLFLTLVDRSGGASVRALVNATR